MRQQNNPANAPEKAMSVRERIPMSMPQLKLAVPDIPGYHLHWMRGDASRIAQAQRAGYEFVETDEIDVTNTGLADDANASGNTDLGSRVSVIGGTGSEAGQPERLYLMKIKEEWWQEDQSVLADRNEQMAAALRGEVPQDSEGKGVNYIPKAHQQTVQNLFHKKN